MILFFLFLYSRINDGLRADRLDGMGKEKVEEPDTTDKSAERHFHRLVGKGFLRGYIHPLPSPPHTYTDIYLF